MNLRYIFPLAVFFLIIIFIYSLLQGPLENDEYLEEIKKKRQEILEYMENDPESPFRLKGEIEYRELEFFDIDPAFCVEAKIEKIPSPLPFNIQMTDGETVEYFKYAIARFTLQSEKQELLLLKSEAFYDDPWLFLPFYDETSAVESYGGGRYLNLEYHDEDLITIDFNLAYNPYCAYNDDYLCPLPPAENRITVKVTAGERNYIPDH
jgi:uncharacterized protein (DUF1684 family)